MWNGGEAGGAGSCPVERRRRWGVDDDRGLERALHCKDVRKRRCKEQSRTETDDKLLGRFPSDVAHPHEADGLSFKRRGHPVNVRKMLSWEAVQL